MSGLTRIIVAMAAVAGLAGCGDGGPGAGDDPGTFVTPPATGTAGAGGSPTAPPALSEAEAAIRYLEIVQPYNEALERLEQAINGGEELATLTGLAGDTADALETEIGQLRGTTWPAAVSAPVDALVTASEQALEHWQEAAQAQSRDDLVDSVLAASEFDGSDPAASIREILNLDAYDENDY